jgi:thiamine pyrophosphate-dependent acetolactate synthase large subunit-like protein
MNQHSQKSFRGLEAVAELLRRAGVDTAFGLLGGSNAAWVAHAVTAGQLRFIRTRHEEAAVTAAAGYSRATGGLGVCTTTKGPGFTNAFNALIAAARGHVPLLFITGQGMKAKPLGSSQEVDQAALAKIAGIGYHVVRELAELEETFWSAARAALHNGQPQALSLGDHWFDQRTELTEEKTRSLRPDLAPDEESIRAAIDELSVAQKPLILAGWGAVLADARDSLIALAEASGARLTTTLRANHFFHGHNSDLGLCGSWSPQIVREIINESDLVLSFGASLTKQTTEAGAIFGGAKLVQCEIDDQATFHASSPELFLLGDARITAEELLRDWKRRGLANRPAPPRGPDGNAIKAAFLKADLGSDPARGLDPRTVYAALDRIFPPGRIVVTDNGRFIVTIPSLIEAGDAKSWLVGNAYGSIGLGLGAAIGAAVAHPDRPVILVTGDGGFAMAAQELDAIRNAGIDNITVAIINDQCYGSDLKYLRRFGLPNTVLHQTLPDIEALARVYGGSGHLITSVDALEKVDFSGPGPKLLDIRVDPEVNVRDAL